jgi:hypothetical protein
MAVANDEINQRNRQVVTTLIDRYANVYDWGIAESLNQCLIHHEILWDQIVCLGDAVSDNRKKTFLLNMIEAATGIHGPYMLQLVAAAPQSVTYADSKKFFLEHMNRP